MKLTEIEQVDHSDKPPVVGPRGGPNLTPTAFTSTKNQVTTGNVYISPNETRLERKTLKYQRGHYESSSSATPYFTDSDRDLVVETETMILRHHNKLNLLEDGGVFYVLLLR